jgi:DNA-binding PadR family transcriptional regulator
MSRIPSLRGDPESLLPLTPAIFHIMLVLADGENHGYAIVKEIEQLTQGRLRIGEGTLYRSTERMLEQGLIEEVQPHDADQEDPRRRTFALTPWGWTVARAEGARVTSLADVVVARGLVRRRQYRGAMKR